MVTLKNYYENLPSGWAVTTIKNISSKIVDGNHNPPAGLNYKTEFMMLSSQNINDDGIVNLEKVRYLTKEQFNLENRRTNIEVNDILFTSVGSIGRSCIYEGGYNICFQRSVSVITSLLNPHYLKLFLDAPKQQDFFIKESNGTAQKGFYLNQLSSMKIMIPPRNEQFRILNMVKNLLFQI